MNYDTVISGNTIQQRKQMNYSYVHHHNGPYINNTKRCRLSLVSHRIDPKNANTNKISSHPQRTYSRDELQSYQCWANEPDTHRLQIRPSWFSCERVLLCPGGSTGWWGDTGDWRSGGGKKLWLRFHQVSTLPKLSGTVILHCHRWPYLHCPAEMTFTLVSSSGMQTTLNDVFNWLLLCSQRIFQNNLYGALQKLNVLSAVTTGNAIHFPVTLFREGGRLTWK